MMPHTIEAVKHRFAGAALDQEAAEYLDFNAERYAHLLGVVDRLRRQMDAEHIRIMDVGPSFFTVLLTEACPADSVLTLGMDDSDARGGHFPPCLSLPSESFHYFNLNNSHDAKQWVQPPSCGLIVISEVLEHLYTSPTHVLRFLMSFLEPGGYLLVTVPNAAAVTKRLALLRGKHPYEMLRENANNPGHFREYTAQELRRIGTQCGLEVAGLETRNLCFPVDAAVSRSWKGDVLRFLLRVLPPSFKGTHVAVYRKPS